MSAPPDTVFSICGSDGETVVTVALVLDVAEPDLAPVENLMTPQLLDLLAGAVAAADQPYSWAAAHVVHAVEHLRRQEYVHAWPPLVIGIEGLYWAEAEQRGFVDGAGRFTAAAPTRRNRPRSAIDVFAVLGMNERVQRFLTRFAFGGEANAFRHGRVVLSGPRHQCLVWLVALAAWLDVGSWPRPWTVA